MEVKREEHLVVAAGKVVVVVTEEDEGCFRGVAAANASLLSFFSSSSFSLSLGAQPAVSN